MVLYYILLMKRDEKTIYTCIYYIHFYDGGQFDVISFLRSFFTQSDDEEEGCLRYFFTVMNFSFYISELFMRLFGR